MVAQVDGVRDVWAAKEVMLSRKETRRLYKIEEDIFVPFVLHLLLRNSLTLDIPLRNKIPRNLPLMETAHNIEFLS